MARWQLGLEKKENGEEGEDVHLIGALTKRGNTADS